MKVITCFSYKGGAGRTTAAANIAAALASTNKNVGSIQAPLGRKVALVDLDVFSAGTGDNENGTASIWDADGRRQRSIVPGM